MDEMTTALRNAKQRYEDFRRHRRAFNPSGRAWYRIERMQDEGATVYIYDAIGIFGIEAERLVKDLDSLEASEITLRVNSPGGDVFDGIAIYNALVRHPATVNTKVDGLAASMASVIALSGNTVEMMPGSFLMIHKPWSIALGDANDFRKEADLLDKIEGQMIEIYSNKSELSADEIRSAAAEETWYTAQEAVDAGFADSVAEDTEPASMSFDLSVFNHTPRGLQGGGEDREPTKREIEMTLRDAGFPSALAKAVAAYGHEGLQDSPGSGDAAQTEQVKLINGLTCRIPI